MKRILVTGASGMLGATLVKLLKNDFIVYATGNSNFKNQYYNYMKFDLSSEDYHELFEWSKPDIIVHCAALTNGNFCEENPDKAFLINSESVSKLVKFSKNNVKIIYISSDAVFPSGSSFVNENCITGADSIYGKSKEAGEKKLIESEKNYNIIRTTIVGLNINSNKTGFIEWMLNSSSKNINIKLFDDVIFTPISIWDFSYEINYIIKSNLTKGIYHISGKDKLTKFEFGMKLLSSLGYNTKNISAGKITNFPFRAKRKKDQSLDCSYYMNITKRNLPNIDETINSIKLNYYEQTN